MPLVGTTYLKVRRKLPNMRVGGPDGILVASVRKKMGVASAARGLLGPSALDFSPQPGLLPPVPNYRR